MVGHGEVRLSNLNLRGGSTQIANQEAKIYDLKDKIDGLSYRMKDPTLRANDIISLGETHDQWTRELTEAERLLTELKQQAREEAEERMERAEALDKGVRLPVPTPRSEKAAIEVANLEQSLENALKAKQRTNRALRDEGNMSPQVRVDHARRLLVLEEDIKTKYVFCYVFCPTFLPSFLPSLVCDLSLLIYYRLPACLPACILRHHMARVESNHHSPSLNQSSSIDAILKLQIQSIHGPKVSHVSER
jgi:hypothetical protein